MEPFAPSGFFVLRTPLLPFDEVWAWGEAASDRTRLRARVASTVSRPEIREAIFLGSPSLHESIPVWEREPESERGRRIERSLMRYLMRMSGRATPFGLFAGCSAGSIGTRTRLHLAGFECYRRHTRLDMEYLFKLAEVAEQDPAVRARLSYRPNSSLYRGGDRVRYAESRFDGTVRTDHLVAVRAAPELAEVLRHAASGARLADLARLLVSDEVTLADAESYVDELVDNQVLVSDLAPAITGHEPTAGLALRLQAAGCTAASERLDRATRSLAALDGRGVGAPPGRYEDVVSGLSALPAEVDRSHLFQVDLIKPVVSATLDPVVVGEIVRGVELLHRISRRPSRPTLAGFREAFEQRYGTAEVPLLEALDADLGVGLEPNVPGSDASPLLDGLALSQPEGVRSWTARDAYLLQRVQRAMESGEREIDLGEHDLASLEPADPPLPLPDAFVTFAALAAESESALDRGDFTLRIDGVGGPSGAETLGRFCHADPEIHRRVAEHLRAEEALRPGTIFAEIVHLPAGRVGNILLRPLLRDYEITYLGGSAAAAERQILPADLCVSIRNGRIVLRSTRLGREVIPRMTTAHNFAGSGLPVYRFLCGLQSESTTTATGWMWGVLESAAFLPRVRAGRLILSPARWQLDRREIDSIAADGPASLSAVEELRRRRGLPRFVTLAGVQDPLPVDLENPFCVEMLGHLIQGGDRATLAESFGVPEGLVASGPEGRFTHELIVPFVRVLAVARSEAATVPSVEAAPASAARRSFPPGSEWLYLKLYGPSSAADRVIGSDVEPFVQELLRVGAVDRWFFIRYADPEPHLRIRVRGDRAWLLADVRPKLEALAIQLHRDGRVWRIQWDTYEREIERYGGPEGIDLAEQVFQIDSEAVADIVRRLSGDAGLDARWRLALRGMDSLLADAGFDTTAALAVVRRARDGFVRELRGGKPLTIGLGERFRKERRALESLLDPAADQESALWPGLVILRRRSERLLPVMSELRVREREGRLAIPVADIAISYLHMFANRLIRSAAPAHEAVLYDFLSRLYASSIARSTGRSRKALAD